jgi:hypothetical protein
VLLCYSSSLIGCTKNFVLLCNVQNIRLSRRILFGVQLNFIRLDTCSAKDVVSDIPSDFATVYSNGDAAAASTSEDMMTAGDAIVPPSDISEGREYSGRSTFAP